MKHRRVGVLLGIVVLVASGAWAAGDDFSGSWTIRESAKGGVVSVEQSGEVVKVNMGGSDRGAISLVADGQVREVALSPNQRQQVSASWDGPALVVQAKVFANDRVVRKTDLRVTRIDESTLSVGMTTRAGNRQIQRNLTLDRQ